MERERGQSSAEYLGLLLLVGLVVAALVVAAPGLAGSLSRGIRSVLCTVFDLACPARGGEAAGGPSYEPEACDVWTRSTEDRGTLKVAFFTVGADYRFARTQDSKGNTTITFVDGGRLGGEAGVGGKFVLTRNGRKLGGGARASGSAELGAARGDTWWFETPEEADEFEGWLRRERNEDRLAAAIPGYGPLNWLIEEITGETPVPEPSVVFREAEAEVGTSASLALNAGGASAELGGAALMGKSSDRRRGTTSEYWKVAAGAGGALSSVGVDLEGAWDGEGVVKVTRNRDGEITEIEIIDRSTTEWGGLATLDTERLTLAGLMRKLARDAEASAGAGSGVTDTVVVTTTLEPGTDEERVVVEDWYGALRSLATAGERALDGELPDSAAAAGSPFADLLYRRARVSVVEYDGQTSGLALAAEVALGPKLGIDLGATEEEARAVLALYLDGPQGAVRYLVPFPACAGG